MSFASFFTNQARKPSGFFGRVVMPIIFDKGNALLNELVAELISIQADDRVLEIGYGTGKLIHDLSRELETGRIDGIDFSETMNKMAERRNRKAISQGKVRLLLGSFDKSRFESNSYDKVCCTNTVYFWQDVGLVLDDIAMVLKPGGTFLMAFEDAEQLKNKPLDSSIFKIHTAEEIRAIASQKEHFDNANIETRQKNDHLFHCLTAEKKAV